MNNLQKAQAIFDSSFGVYGYGHFNLYVEDVAEILDLLESEDIEGLKNLYERLEEARMG